MIFQSCFYEMFQIRRFSVFAGTGRSLKDDRRVQFSSGLGNALDDFHVVDVECTDSIVAFIGFLNISVVPINGMFTFLLHNT